MGLQPWPVIGIAGELRGLAIDTRPWEVCKMRANVCFSNREAKLYADRQVAVEKQHHKGHQMVGYEIYSQPFPTGCIMDCQFYGWVLLSF